jgi:hypothetical protein
MKFLFSTLLALLPAVSYAAPTLETRQEVGSFRLRAITGRGTTPQISAYLDVAPGGNVIANTTAGATGFVAVSLPPFPLLSPSEAPQAH